MSSTSPKRALTSEQAAEHAGMHALLSCWLREVPGWSLRPRSADGGPAVVIPLPGQQSRIVLGVLRESHTYRHRLAMPPYIETDADDPLRPLTLTALTELLADLLRVHGDATPISVDAMIPRVIDSAAVVADHLRLRADDVESLWSPRPLGFAETEQALLLGHPTHPTPKSRTEMDPEQRRRFSPETGGRFRLHWLAVDPGIVRQDSATGTRAQELTERLLRDDPCTDGPSLDRALRPLGRRVIIPAHPYEAGYLAADERSGALFESGAVVDLGEWGSPYLPTTSVRTVYRREAPWQLKFSLHVRITNSMRVTLPKELDRAVEAARLARTAVGERAAAIAPDFVCVHDSAYLTVGSALGTHDGFSVLLRENRWDSAGPGDVTALTTLCQDHPYGGDSRLVAIVRLIAERDGRTAEDVAREWFARFRAVVVRSLLRLYLDVGLCFEAHQQNTLVELADGWPVRGVYRDSQGYFHRNAAHADLTAVVPGVGEATESIFPEELADERLVYYLFVNLTLGVVDALGCCIDENVLLADLREELIEQRRLPARYPATLIDRLLDDARWPCKANLLTRANDMDELVGDIAAQSVYVSVPNPLKDLG